MVEARSSASHKSAPTVHPAGLAPISNTAHSRSPGLRVDASTVAFPAARPVAWSRMKLTAYSCGGSSRIGPEPARHSRLTSSRRHCAHYCVACSLRASKSKATEHLAQKSARTRRFQAALSGTTGGLHQTGSRRSSSRPCALTTTLHSIDVRGISSAIFAEPAVCVLALRIPACLPNSRTRGCQ